MRNRGLASSAAAAAAALLAGLLQVLVTPAASPGAQPPRPEDPLRQCAGAGRGQNPETMIGGCPHPNNPGHDDLSRTLDAAFRSL